MKISINMLLAALLAGPALAQSPPPLVPALVPPPAPSASAETDFQIMDLRAAAVPMVADPLDTAQHSDPIWVAGDRPAQNHIASLTLRPVEAAVIEQDIGQGTGHNIVLSLAVTGALRGFESRASLAAAEGERFYCGMGLSGRFEGRIMCLADRDHDGRFESGAIGIGETAPDPRQLSMIGKVEPLPAPIPYRLARDAERPAMVVDYTNCARDHDRPRFTAALHADGPALTLDELMRAGPDAMRTNPELARRIIEEAARRAPGGAFCQSAAKVSPGEPLYPSALESGAAVARFDELVIAVGPQAQGTAGAPVRLLGLRDPDRLYRLTGIALAPLSNPPTLHQRQLANAQRFHFPVLMLAAEPELREGPARVGDTILRAEIRHGYMGVLTQDTVIRTILSRRSLAAGTVLYGVPMSTRRVMTINGTPVDPLPNRQSGDVELTWCVPVEDESRWTATCLPQQEGRYTILKGQQPAFEVRSMRYDAGTSTNEGEVPVAAREGSFGRPLRYAFTVRAIEESEIVIAQETLFGDAIVNHREIRLPRASGRPSLLRMAGGAISLAAGPDGSLIVARIAPFRVGADVMQVDADLAKSAPAAPPPPR